MSRWNEGPGEGHQGEGRDWTAAAGLAVESGGGRGVVLRWPRALATLIMGYVIVALSSTLFDWWSVGPLQLQPLVVVVVSAGFRLPLWPAAALTLFLGYLTDLCSGPPLGMQMTSYVFVLCVCAVAERKLDISSWALQMLAVGLMSFLQQALVLTGMALMHEVDEPLADLAAMTMGHALLCALTAPLFFAALEGLVGLISRVSPAGGKGGQ